ncbi:MAG TPA: hypothetical protein VJN22_05810 [Candidatus Eremiobacteraceae bacterium]|nr:hypothetical protein [Candidatus Eremiobacteraceae bacterium]
MPPQGGFQGQQPNGNPAPTSPNPFSSVSPGPTTSPDTIYLSSTVLRAAYDGSASDPVKASRLLEITFGFKNPTADADTLSTYTVAVDDDPAGHRNGLSLSIPAGKSSDVAVAAVSLKQDLAKVKHLTLSFANIDGDEIATTTLPPPSLTMTFTPLDDKQPSGALSIVGIDFSHVTGPGSGLHYECTFGMVNASGAKVVVDNFTVTPPKGSPVTVPVPVTIPARTSSSLFTVVIPYSGKSLPGGKYTITANSANNALAQATTGLI